MTNPLIDLLAKDAGIRPLSMCHFIAGFPSASSSEDIGNALIEGGADILELQIPFSDPMADGPAIASACQDALAAGMNVKKSLALAKRLSRKKTPIVLMSYINPIFKYGIAAFVRDASRAGISGLIVPDAPFDSHEGQEMIEHARKHAMCMIPVISPGVPIERLQQLAKDGSGFVYCTTRQGTTGANSKFAHDLKAYIEMARKVFEMPLGLGFGVRTRQDFKTASEIADIVIAGSVFVHAIRSAKKGHSASVRKTLQKIVR
jgi:tryptophan synthase alpha chain